MKEKYIAIAKENEAQLIADRRYLHENPEFSMELPGTVAYVRKRLESMGYQVSDCGGGLTCTAGSGGPVILLRADMDALKVTEDNDLPFKSTNGFAHVCGHDTHTAMLLGAAKILKEMETQLRGRVKFMFQPAEETIIGAKAMTEDGILENPKVDAALAMHVMPHITNGEFHYKREMCFSYMDIFTIEVRGVGGHGSMPDKCVDPIFSVVQIYNMLNGIVARQSSMFDSAVLTVGALNGGSMPNVIPDTAKLEGTLRCYNGEIRDRIMAEIEQIADAVCTATGTTFTYSTRSTKGIYNNPDFCDAVLPFVEEIIEDKVIEDKLPNNASEDFSLISHEVPSMFMLMGVGEEGAPGLHDPKAIFREEKLYLGSAVLSYAAAKWLESKN